MESFSDQEIQRSISCPFAYLDNLSVDLMHSPVNVAIILRINPRPSFSNNMVCLLARPFDGRCFFCLFFLLFVCLFLTMARESDKVQVKSFVMCRVVRHEPKVDGRSNCLR